MQRITLGRTGLIVSRSGFGAIPIQRLNIAEAKKLLQKAYSKGINFFDTARGYSDSEEKIGAALSEFRKEIIIATKAFPSTGENLLRDLKTSLRNLQTDYIDVYQLHNPKSVPGADDPEGLYAALIEAKQQGLIRFIGITNHKIELALEAASSGLYDTVQFPLSPLSSPTELEIIDCCRKHNVGLIAMKALGGGLITRAAASFAYLRQFDNVVPIWGIEKETELDEFMAMEENPPALDQELLSVIETDRRELGQDFCRGCGYCTPCPMGINIPWVGRMALLLKRARYQTFLTAEWRESMELIESCTYCGHCQSKCPYQLDTPRIIRKNLDAYRDFYRQHSSEAE